MKHHLSPPRYVADRRRYRLGRLRILVVALTPTVTLMTGCGMLPGAGVESVSTTTAPAARTPLQVRDELRDLDIFRTCYDPVERETGPGYAATEVNCYVLDQEADNQGTNRERGVTAFILPGTWEDFETDFCLWRLNADEKNDGMRLVTDSANFVVFGRLDNLFGEWPQEVWPEDVQRALGGEVVTLGVLCDRRYAN